MSLVAYAALAATRVTSNGREVTEYRTRRITERNNVKAVFATLAAVLTLVGVASIAGVIAQVRVIRAERRDDVVRNLREAR